MFLLVHFRQKIAVSYLFKSSRVCSLREFSQTYLFFNRKWKNLQSFYCNKSLNYHMNSVASLSEFVCLFFFTSPMLLLSQGFIISILELEVEFRAPDSSKFSVDKTFAVKIKWLKYYFFNTNNPQPLPPSTFRIK